MKCYVVLGLLFVSTLTFAVNETLDSEDLVIATRTARFIVDGDIHTVSKLCNKSHGVTLAAFKPESVYEVIEEKIILEENKQPSVMKLEDGYVLCSTSVTFQVKDYNKAFNELKNKYGPNIVIQERFDLAFDNFFSLSEGFDKLVNLFEKDRAGSHYSHVYSFIYGPYAFSSIGSKVLYTSNITLNIHRKNWKAKP